MMEENYKVFGWRGISFEIPQNWELGAIQDSEEKGSLRFNDLKITRLELEWRKERQVFSLEKIVNRYIETLRKKAKRTGLELEIKRDLKITPLKEKVGEFFYWKADYQSYNLISYCFRSSYLIFLRVLANLKEDIEEKVKRIYKTLRTYSLEKNLWSVYDLCVKIPKEFYLFDYSFKTGNVELSFKRKKDFLNVRCISLASILLRNKDLRELSPELCRGYLKGFKYNFGEEPCYSQDKRRGYDVIKIEGMKKIFFRTLNNEIVLIHSPYKNKIFVLRLLSKEKNSKILDQILNEINS
ncbi:hypothetical protein AUJ66_08285 [Candidatus Desantisbacteria bacterium CG1_02_38_46]|uniref:Uncharacterized protein n=3 Tax=unclassified Candidatus Desantisiibacteriota TaxID=3106372 RepID=A0A2H9PC63_9BACT|nr:MAG: hypothetical protein AUJ66_08285 [Candidatus Desantisbacteria bacterium CG1_02_38_46]PIU50909.1 MAG: hypothetical protein COS91_07285 [Candidatus Desantisbacteria bacterium CG07_land_8_20_14_0_80_39_15]PIZ16619.1 MAG: hypothetical protein COY51_02195 [Candidatus Desantisbacteria bacterium CG_4_10_14_0_8_um_filter_39_17]